MLVNPGSCFAKSPGLMPFNTGKLVKADVTPLVALLTSAPRLLIPPANCACAPASPEAACVAALRTSPALKPVNAPVLTCFSNMACACSLVRVAGPSMVNCLAVPSASLGDFTYCSKLNV